LRGVLTRLRSAWHERRVRSLIVLLKYGSDVEIIDLAGCLVNFECELFLRFLDELDRDVVRVDELVVDLEHRWGREGLSVEGFEGLEMLGFGLLDSEDSEEDEGDEGEL